MYLARWIAVERYQLEYDVFIILKNLSYILTYVNKNQAVRMYKQVTFQVVHQFYAANYTKIVNNAPKYTTLLHRMMPKIKCFIITSKVPTPQVGPIHYLATQLLSGCLYKKK